jgi:exoribonuclease R
VSVELPRRFVAEVARDGTRWVICGLFSEDRVELDDPPAPDGAIVRVTQPTKGSIGDGRAPAPDLEVVALPGSARATMLRLLASHRLDPEHPVDVLAEVHALLHSPGIDDPALADQTARAFVTVDGEGTRDLDQALHVEAHGEGFVVRYAIADASWFVRPGSALFSEALRRGASYYLPGLSAPMLPRELSEGLVSLNPGVDRRAIVFEMHVDF